MSIDKTFGFQTRFQFMVRGGNGHHEWTPILTPRKGPPVTDVSRACAENASSGCDGLRSGLLWLLYRFSAMASKTMGALESSHAFLGSQRGALRSEAMHSSHLLLNGQTCLAARERRCPPCPCQLHSAPSPCRWGRAGPLSEEQRDPGAWAWDRTECPGRGEGEALQ